MYYYYGNDYVEAITNPPVKIETTKVLRQYQSVYHEVIEAQQFAVYYWNDEEDYPVAVFNVIALDESDAEDRAREAGGDQYEQWPVFVEEISDDDEVEEYKKDAESGRSGCCKFYKEVKE